MSTLSNSRRTPPMPLRKWCSSPPGGWGAAAAPLVLRYTTLTRSHDLTNQVTSFTVFLGSDGRSRERTLAPAQKSSSNTCITRGLGCLELPHWRSVSNDNNTSGNTRPRKNSYADISTPPHGPSYLRSHPAPKSQQAQPLDAPLGEVCGL